MMINVSHNSVDPGFNVNGGWTLGPVVFDAIRAVHPYTPILIFGGMRRLFSARNHLDL